MKKIQKLIVGLLTVLSIFSLVSFAGLSSAKADSNQSSVSAIKSAVTSGSPFLATYNHTAGSTRTVSGLVTTSG